MNTRKLSKFLVNAKKNTYASKGETGEAILIDGGKEFRFKENEFLYIDKYFGFNPFIGEEIVFENEKVIWGMNYYGGITEKIIPEKEVYQFLKEALKKVSEKSPFRGYSELKIGFLKYQNKVKGDIKKFQGEEAIYFKGKIIYRLSFYGGRVDDF